MRENCHVLSTARFGHHNSQFSPSNHRREIKMTGTGALGKVFSPQSMDPLHTLDQGMNMARGSSGIRDAPSESLRGRIIGHQCKRETFLLLLHTRDSWSVRHTHTPFSVGTCVECFSLTNGKGERGGRRGTQITMRDFLTFPPGEWVPWSV